MKVVADSHAIFWYLRQSPSLSATARDTLRGAEEITVSVATIVDLWYVTQTKRTITADELARVRSALERSSRVELRAIDATVADAYTQIPRSTLTDRGIGSSSPQRAPSTSRSSLATRRSSRRSSSKRSGSAVTLA